MAWRGWAATILLIAVASVPAWWLSRSRAGDLQRARIHPPGWSVSFYPPNRFDAEVKVTDHEVRVFTFRRPLDLGFAEIRVEKFDDADPSRGAVELCERVLRPHNSLIVAVLGPKPRPVAMRLGGWEGVEVNHPPIGMVVRAAVVAGTEGYAVSLRIDGEPLDEPTYSNLYRTFEAVCESVSGERGRGGNIITKGRDPRQP